MIALVVALALADPSAPIVSDRPDVTNGTLTVPKGGVQVEVGLDAELARRRVEASPLALESALRIGISDRAELRLLEGDLLEWATAATDRDGSFRTGSTLRASTRAIDDVPLLEFSSKLRLFDEDIRRWIPALGLQPIIAFRPPGQAYRGLPVLGLVFIVSQPMGKLIILDMNAAARIDGNVSPRRMVSGYVSGSIGVQVHPKVLLYTELLAVVAKQGDESVIVDGGLLVHVHSRIIFDLSARVSPIASSRAAGVVAGMTALLADARRPWRRRATSSPGR